MSGGNKCSIHHIKYLSQREAIQLDRDLFNEYKFSVGQLVELAGWSVAAAVSKEYPPHTHQSALIICNICGPGNNGAAGLVAARHMVLFGYNVSIHYPRRNPKPLFENLLKQCESFGVKILARLPPVNELQHNYSFLIDALFEFSYKTSFRDERLNSAMDALINAGLPVCSVDIPSGWDVNHGPGEGVALKPDLLVSLSAPKLCSKPKELRGAKHYLGGRFLPPGIIEKYKLSLPQYPGQEQVVQLSCSGCIPLPWNKK